MSSSRLRIVVSTACAILCVWVTATTPSIALGQTNGTWTTTNGGTWGDSANWSGGNIASGIGATANFSTLDITGVQTVTLNEPRTSGTLLFGDTTGTNGGWTLTSSTLTLATASGVPTISVTGLGNASAFGSQAATIASVIAGTQGLSKTGTSALVLSAANTYSGTTTVTGGYLVLNHASALGSSTSVTASGGAAIAIGNGITAGSGASFSLVSAGISSFAGLAAISGGTGTWAGAVSIDNNTSRIGYQNNSVLVLSGSISGSSANPLLINGYGGAGSTGVQNTSVNTQYAVIVSGTNNSYAGETRIARGVLKIGADNALPTTTTLDIKTSAVNGSEAAAFDLNGFNQAVASLRSSAITSGSGSVGSNGSAFLMNSGSTVKTLTVNQATSGTFYGIISGSLAFTKSGAADLTLMPTLVLGASLASSGTNTFSGDTLVSGGSLTLGNASALFGSSFDSSGAGQLSFGSLTAATLGGLKGSGNLALQNSSSQAVALTVGGNGGATSFSGNLTGLGSLTKTGTGTLALSGSSGYSGATTLAGGVVALGNANALPSSGNITFTGGSLQYSASNTADIAARIVSSTAAISIDTNGQNIAWAGNLASSNTGGLTKRGAGTLTLSGSSSLTGPIMITGGALVLANSSALNTSGAFAYTIDSGTLASRASVVAGGPGFLFGSVSIGPGGATIRSDLRADNTTVISGTSPTASLTYGTSSGTVSGVIMVISGNNTYAGGTKIESGIDMVVDNNSAFGTGTLDLAGARIRSRNNPQTLANAVTISANTQFFGGASEPNLTFTGATLLSGGTRTLNVSSVITGGTSVGQPGVIFTNAISDGGNGYGITKTGAGVLALAGANTYTGITTLNAGTLQLRNQAALQHSTLSLSGTGGVLFDSVVASNAFTFGGLSSSSSAATLALQNSSAAAIGLTIGANNASTTYAGTLTGLGSLVKAGAGKVTLSGNNSYAGTTTVSNGILAVNGNQSSALGAFSVAAGASLMGSGTIGGATTIQGLHSPGNSPGIQTFAGDLTYSGGSSSVLWELAANTNSNSPLAYDQIVVGRNLDFAGLTALSLLFNSAGSTVNWSDTFWESSRTWTLFSVSGATTNFGNLVLAGSPSSWLDTQSTPQSLSVARPDASFSIVQDGNNVNIVYAIVPEPGALALAGVGIVGAMGVMARKRFRASTITSAGKGP